MNKMKIVLIYLSLVLLCGPASAVMRVWPDAQGNLVEGEYVRVASNQVIVRDRAGKANYIPLKGLSAKDMEYLTSVYVPEVVINFSKRASDVGGKDLAQDDDKISIVTGTVEVKIKPKIPNDTLRAEAYLIGAEVVTPDYRIKSKVLQALKFTEENNFTAEFQLEMESREYMEYNLQMRGTVYAGYLVLVLNQKNEIISHKTDISWLKEEKIPLLRRFRVDAFFDDNCKPRSVPRPEYSSGRVGW
jgi:hypothetical protein